MEGADNFPGQEDGFREQRNLLKLDADQRLTYATPFPRRLTTRAWLPALMNRMVAACSAQRGRWVIFLSFLSSVPNCRLLPGAGNERVSCSAPWTMCNYAADR